MVRDVGGMGGSSKIDKSLRNQRLRQETSAFHMH